MSILEHLIHQSPLAFEDIHIITNSDSIDVSLELPHSAETGLTYESSCHLKQFIQMFIDCAVTLIHPPQLVRITAEIVHVTNGDWMDAMGDVLCIEWDARCSAIRVEHHDPHALLGTMRYVTPTDNLNQLVSKLCL